MVMMCSSSRDNMLISTNIRERIEYSCIGRYYLPRAIPPYLPQFDGVCMLVVLVINANLSRFSFPLPLPFELPASIFNILCLSRLRNLWLLSILTSQILFNVEKSTLNSSVNIGVQIGWEPQPIFLSPFASIAAPILALSASSAPLELLYVGLPRGQPLDGRDLACCLNAG